MYKITFLLRIHNDYHERRVIDCTAKQIHYDHGNYSGGNDTLEWV